MKVENILFEGIRKSQTTFFIF